MKQHAPTAEGSKWLCHHCGFVTRSLDDAIRHIESDLRNLTHWLYEHPNGHRSTPASREMHSSDAGGVYITECDARMERKRIDVERAQTEDAAW